jgi:ATP-binding cassette subfamily C protein
MNPAELLVVLLIFFRIAVKVSVAQKMWHGVLLNAPGYQAIVDEIGDAERAVVARPPIGRGIQRPHWSHVVLDRVSYEYVAGSAVLTHVSLSVPANKTVALVGASGSGKSTIVDLILGLLSPTHGTIRIDDVDLRDLDHLAWRGQIGYVAQESVLFNDSVRNNIRWGRPSATDEEIRTVARLAQAEEFIGGMRDGYDTVVGDRGGRLSGGQRQRIALAAALIRRPRLLILDEATSNLDAASEQALRQAIDALKGEMTIFIVAHRLATVANADWIYVIERGTVVQQGTCDELRQRRGRFQDLWTLQQHSPASREGVPQITGEQR